MQRTVICRPYCDTTTQPYHQKHTPLCALQAAPVRTLQCQTHFPQAGRSSGLSGDDIKPRHLRNHGRTFARRFISLSLSLPRFRLPALCSCSSSRSQASWPCWPCSALPSRRRQCAGRADKVRTHDLPATRSLDSCVDSRAFTTESLPTWVQRLVRVLFLALLVGPICAAVPYSLLVWPTRMSLVSFS